MQIAGSTGREIQVCSPNSGNGISIEGVGGAGVGAGAGVLAGGVELDEPLEAEPAGCVELDVEVVLALEGCDDAPPRWTTDFTDFKGVETILKGVVVVIVGVLSGVRGALVSIGAVAASTNALSWTCWTRESELSARSWVVAGRLATTFCRREVWA